MNPDVIIMGAGIAGSSAAYFASDALRVLLLEREEQPGYHTSGRSAALYTENYGADILSALVRASRTFLIAPPPGFCEHPLVGPLGLLSVADAQQADAFEEAYATARRRIPSVERHGADFALAKAPILKRAAAAACYWERDAFDIDVHALHQGYLRGLRAKGGAVATEADVQVIARRDGHWQVTTAKGDVFRAPILVNAAGAWADRIAALAGAAPIGIEPRRRTAMLVDLPEPLPGLPMVSDVCREYYFRPSGGKLLVSPVDQTPSEPCDAQPEEIDVAIAIDRLMAVTTLKVMRVATRWAGLRSFAPDEIPVAGWDDAVPGFYWLAGQGGAGIKTSPALGRLAASALKGEAVPESLTAEGIAADALSPHRLRGAR